LVCLLNLVNHPKHSHFNPDSFRPVIESLPTNKSTTFQFKKRSNCLEPYFCKAKYFVSYDWSCMMLMRNERIFPSGTKPGRWKMSDLSRKSDNWPVFRCSNWIQRRLTKRRSVDMALVRTVIWAFLIFKPEFGNSLF
jgi:hypothetical protein